MRIFSDIEKIIESLPDVHEELAEISSALSAETTPILRGKDLKLWRILKKLFLFPSFMPNHIIISAP